MKRLTYRDANGEAWYSDAGTERDRLHRLAAIDDILCDGEDDYDLDRLAVMCNQRMTMRDEVSERFGLTKDIPLDRLRELVEADREGRCVVLPCKIDDDVYINLFGRTLDATVISISELASTPTYKAMYGIRLCYISRRMMWAEPFSSLVKPQKQH